MVENFMITMQQVMSIWVMMLHRCISEDSLVWSVQENILVIIHLERLLRTILVAMTSVDLHDIWQHQMVYHLISLITSLRAIMSMQLVSMVLGRIIAVDLLVLLPKLLLINLRITTTQMRTSQPVLVKTLLALSPVQK